MSVNQLHIVLLAYDQDITSLIASRNVQKWVLYI